MVEEGRRTGESVSEVCRRHQIGLTQFYQWEKQARRGALQELGGQKRGPGKDGQVKRLEGEVAQMRQAVAEMALEMLELKRGHWG